MIINIEQALNLIDTTIYIEGSSKPQYFFIVGAGISMPEIPSAKGIVDRCKSEVKKRNEEYYNLCVEKTDKFSNEPMKYYSAWISEAFPNPVNRSDFFKELNANAKISSANLMLAQILNSRKLAQTVFTTNFDDKIKAALNIIGANDVFISENAMDNLVVKPNSDAIQIVHVHGTYNFYDCANIESEINAVANQSGVISSYNVLSRFLHSQAPIIIGYSGWENDVIMSCLEERLKYPTPLNYIWVCYSREDYEQLPEWIRKSNQVQFVVADTIDKHEEHLDYKIGGNSFCDKIDATYFFSTLLNKFKISPPELFVNPFGYYSKMINNVLPEHEDVLHLRHWAQRLQYLSSGNETFERFVSEFEAASINSDVEKAILLINEVADIDLAVGDATFVCSELIKDFLNLERNRLGFEQRISFRLSCLNFIEKNYNNLLTSNALTDVLHLLLFIVQIEDAVRQKYLQFVDRICDISKRDQSTLSVLLSALGVKAVLVEKTEEKLKLLKDLVNRCPSECDSELIMFYKGQALLDIARLQHTDQSIETYRKAEEIIEQSKMTFLKRKSIVVKSQLLYKVKDKNALNEFMIEILHSLSEDNLEFSQHDKLWIMRNVSETYTYELANAEQIEAGCMQFVCENKSLEFTNRYEAIYYVQICLALYKKSQKIELGNIAYVILDGYFGKDADSDLISDEAYLCYFKLPTSIMADMIKIEKLKRIKMRNNVSKDVFCEMLEECLNEGDEKLYNDISEFSDELERIKRRKMCSQAVDLYINKNFFEAESIFKELMCCEDEEIASIARVNLSFMVRRGETQTLQRDAFREIIDLVTEPSAIKSMNEILYCITEGDTKCEMYKSAIEELEGLNAVEILEAIDWWSDVDVVGEQESKTAMDILASYTNNEMS